MTVLQCCRGSVGANAVPVATSIKRTMSNLTDMTRKRSVFVLGHRGDAGSTADIALVNDDD